MPDALFPISPAVAMGKDEYFQGLLAKRALGRGYPPDERMERAPPPTVVFNGSVDNLTPIDGVRHYCELAKRHGGECALYVYKCVGHLFTRKQPFAMRNFDTYPKAWADATNKGDAFLAGRVFCRCGIPPADSFGKEKKPTAPRPAAERLRAEVGQFYPQVPS